MRDTMAAVSASEKSPTMTSSESLKTRKVCLERRLERMVRLLFVIALLHSCLIVPMASAFSHTNYQPCNSKFKSKVGSHCDYGTHYCGYVVIRLPRGGYESADCIPKRNPGYACKYSEQCYSGSCSWGMCD